MQGKWSADTRTNLHRHTTLLADMATDPRTTRTSIASTFSATFGKHTGKDYGMVNRNQNLQGERDDQLEKGFSLKEQ